MAPAQRGMALVAALMLLAGLASLALAAAAAAMTALAVAGYQQSQARAFVAAEAAIASVLRSEMPANYLGEAASATTRAIGSSPPPPGYSLGAGENSFVARHFRIVAEGRAERGTQVILEQGYRVIGPAP